MAALYSEVLLDHFRHPRNYGKLHAPDIEYENVNPLCGDRVRIELRLNHTVVTELILGTDICDSESISDDRLISALESDIKPATPQCALLPLKTLREGLRNHRI